MRVSDADILFIPGFMGSGQEHWQTRWSEKMSTAQMVDLPDPMHPKCDAWAHALLQRVETCKRPVILVAHALGVHVVVQAAPKLNPERVKGAFLVSPVSETAILEVDTIDMKFAPAPRDPLPFPSVLIASSNDPLCPVLDAEEWAYAWGSAFTNAGDSGHINVESGHGPWPEGLMRFAGFMAKI
jgi:uncharacterized protein